jgi:hypothetical protein
MAAEVAIWPRWRTDPLWKFTDHRANAQNLKPKCHHNIEFSKPSKGKVLQASYWNLFVQRFKFWFSRDPMTFPWTSIQHTQWSRKIQRIKNHKERWNSCVAGLPVCFQLLRLQALEQLN